MAQGNGRKRGVVKWFNQDKGYGFIKPEDRGNDVFVHFSGIDAPRGSQVLFENDEVEFDVVEGKKGLQATKVRMVGVRA